MTKPGDLPTTKKTIHELVKEFPEKTYNELEKYRDADRREEAQRIITQQENEELKEDQLTESQRRQMELEPIEKENQRDPKAIDWQDEYDKEHRLRQEAEGELTIVKTITIDSSPEMRDAKEKIKELQSNLDRIKKENNDLYNRIAKLSEEDLQKARESGL
jgi:hypothetical protein